VDIQEKLVLVETLAARIGWVIQAYAKRVELDNSDFENAELAYIQYEDDGTFETGYPARGQTVDTDENLRAFALAIQGVAGNELAFARLDYNFLAGRLVLEMEGAGHSSGALGYLHNPEHLLEFFEEADIRRAFAEHEALFLKQTNTTAEDWRLEG
jgi:hypothetical protein